MFVEYQQPPPARTSGTSGLTHGCVKGRKCLQGMVGIVFSSCSEKKLLLCQSSAETYTTFCLNKENYRKNYWVRSGWRWEIQGCHSGPMGKQFTAWHNSFSQYLSSGSSLYGLVTLSTFHEKLEYVLLLFGYWLWSVNQISCGSEQSSQKSSLYSMPLLQLLVVWKRSSVAGSG